MTGLRLDGVSHAYGKNEVVREVSFAVQPGELVCLLGPSGCGKTTLLRLAAGLEPAQKGRVVIEDNLVADAESGLHVPPEHRGVGLMFQDFALFPHLTIFENVIFGIAASAGERRQWSRDVLARMNMAALAETYPHTLSGGQQQRVALLRALAPEPRVLLLDEPFSDLDANSRTQVREETLALLKETQVATLMVTHDPEEAMFMADRIIVMRNGVIAQTGTPREIYFQPCNTFVAGLFGPANRLRGVVHRGCVETPLGVFDAPGLSEGCPARIIIRPESVTLTRGEIADAAGILGRVTSARLLGRSSYLRVCCCDDTTREEFHLQARVPGVFLPENGTSVSVRIDKESVFVFDAT